MGMIRTLGAVTVTSGTPTPAILPILANIAAASFSITNNIATIVLGSALPKVGYNGSRGFGNAGPDLGGSAIGQQVILWGFTVATYFNGLPVTVLDNDGNRTFRFAFTHANVGSTSDAGETAPVPFEHYRAVRIEADKGNGTDAIYVGDAAVSSTQYMADLTLAGQIAVEISSDNIPAARIMLDGTTSSDKAQVTLIY